MMKGLNRTLPGLGSFYMVRWWADAMVGASMAALSGSRLVGSWTERISGFFRTSM
jgi:hypothetical protein